MFETLNELEPESQKQSPVQRKRSRRIVLLTLIVVAPVYGIFLYLGRPEMGFAASIYVGMAALATLLLWDLRGHIWFWAAISFILALHAPLLVYFPFPSRLHGIELLPIGLADWLIYFGCIKLLEKLTRTKEKETEGEV